MWQDSLEQHYIKRANLKFVRFFAVMVLIAGLLGSLSTATYAQKSSPAVDFELNLPLYLGQLEPKSSEGIMLYLQLDKKGLAEAQFLPVRLAEGRIEALPPQERANGLAALSKRFPPAENSAWKAEAVFWNGSAWQVAPALAYFRDVRADGSINLPLERTLQVRDLAGASGGFSTGKEVTDFAKEVQTDQRIELKNGQLKVWRPDPRGEWQVIWESKPGWQVKQFGFGDADEDGRNELIFTLWKSDGPDDKGQSRSHPFVYGWRRAAFRPVWAGSALADPIREFALSNFAQSGSGPTNQLVVLEGSYAETQDAPARYVTVWQWNGWGYELLWRSAAGTYSALHYVPGQPFAVFKRADQAN